MTSTGFIPDEATRPMGKAILMSAVRAITAEFNAIPVERRTSDEQQHLERVHAILPRVRHLEFHRLNPDDRNGEFHLACELCGGLAGLLAPEMQIVACTQCHEPLATAEDATAVGQWLVAESLREKRPMNRQQRRALARLN